MTRMGSADGPRKQCWREASFLGAKHITYMIEAQQRAHQQARDYGYVVIDRHTRRGVSLSKYYWHLRIALQPSAAACLCYGRAPELHKEWQSRIKWFRWRRLDSSEWGGRCSVSCRNKPSTIVCAADHLSAHVVWLQIADESRRPGKAQSFRRLAKGLWVGWPLIK